MGAAHEVMPQQRVLALHRVGKDALELVPPHVAVAVARGGGEAVLAHIVVNESRQHLLLVLKGVAFDMGKGGAQLRLDFLAQCQQAVVNVKKFSHNISSIPQK